MGGFAGLPTARPRARRRGGCRRPKPLPSGGPPSARTQKRTDGEHAAAVLLHAQAVRLGDAQHPNADKADGGAEAHVPHGQRDGEREAGIGQQPAVGRQGGRAGGVRGLAPGQDSGMGTLHGAPRRSPGRGSQQGVPPAGCRPTPNTLPGRAWCVRGPTAGQHPAPWQRVSGALGRSQILSTPCLPFIK